MNYYILNETTNELTRDRWGALLYFPLPKITRLQQILSDHYKDKYEIMREDIAVGLGYAFPTQSKVSITDL